MWPLWYLWVTGKFKGLPFNCLEEFTQAENFPEQQKLERVMRPPETPKPPLVDMESRRAKMATLVESISDFEVRLYYYWEGIR